MGHAQHTLNGHPVGTGRLAITGTLLAAIGFITGDGGIISHGFLFSALGHKIMIIAHDGIDRDLPWANGFTASAGMAAVELTAMSLIGCQHFPVIPGQTLSGQANKSFQVFEISHRTTHGIDPGLAEHKTNRCIANVLRI